MATLRRWGEVITTWFGCAGAFWIAHIAHIMDNPIVSYGMIAVGSLTGVMAIALTVLTIWSDRIHKTRGES